MAAEIIPVNTVSSVYNFGVELGDTNYIIKLAWNTRDSRWYITIRDSDGVDIVSGRAVVINYPLFLKHASEDLPNGFIQAIDTTGSNEEIQSQEDLGDRVKLVYTPASDV